jgi:hypothetical protein
LEDKLLLAEFLIYYTAKDIFGRAKFKPMRAIKKLPTPAQIRRFIIDGDQNQISGAEVIAAIKIMCKVMSFVCPVVGEKFPDK